MKYRITPINPLISRDARPFGTGGRVKSLEWLSQTVIAGAVRSLLWKECRSVELVKQVKVSGTFPVVNGKIYFPRPLDIIADKENIYSIRPIQNFPENCGADMPVNGLLPAFPDTEKDFKPERINSYWQKKLISQWLRRGSKNFTLDDTLTLKSPEKDERVHVNINSSTGTSNEGMLFSTVGLDFTRKISSKLEQGNLSVDIELPQELAGLMPEKFIVPIGGERRLAEFTRDDYAANGLETGKFSHDGLDNTRKNHNVPADNGKTHKPANTLWNAPSELETGKNLRMILATPAIFSHGWFPGWIDEENLTGTIPNTDVKVKLISAVTGRWQAVSGWSYEHETYGPKPIRRAVPAGSVYFFELQDGNFDAKANWLKSICDDECDVNDGFGLALWGNWEYNRREIF